MSHLIYSGSVDLLDDVIETDEADVLSADSATRKLMVRASSDADARDFVSIGSTLPSESHMFCTRRRASPLICGHLYELQADYKGILDSKSDDVRLKEALESWDTGSRRRIVTASSEKNARETFAHGSSLPGYANVVCVDRDAEPIVPGQIYLAVAEYKGIASVKPAKFIPRTFADKQSSSGGYYPGQTTRVPFDSFQPMVGMTVYWFSTVLPNMNVAGTNITPDEAPSVPPSIWASIDNPVHTYPYGWVLDDRTIERIAGETLCLVTDVYSYYHRYKP